jgi:putative transposase
MRMSRFTDAQIVAVLHEWDAGLKTSDLLRRHGFTEPTLHCWKKSTAGCGMRVAEALKARGA